MVAVSSQHCPMLPLTPAVSEQGLTGARWSRLLVALHRIAGCFPLLKRQDCLALTVPSSFCLVLLAELHPNAAEVRTMFSRDRVLTLPAV